MLAGAMMASFISMLSARRGHGRADWTDWVSYAYLVLGLALMFGPVVWLVLSSFKSAAALNEFPPQLLPYGQKSVAVSGHENPLPLFRVALPDGTTRELAEVRRIGIQSTLVDPPRRSRRSRSTSATASRCVNFGSRSGTTPKYSASSRSARFCGTACSSR